MTALLRREDLADVEPLLLRALAVDAQTFIRLRADAEHIAAFVRLPYDVLAGRTLTRAGGGVVLDATYAGQELADWLAAKVDTAALPESDSADSASPESASPVCASPDSGMAPDSDEPTRRDAHWLTALPPRAGWNRIQKIPDGAIRELVRGGATLAKDITARKQQEALLSATVLTAAADQQAGNSADVPLRAFTALTKMGFLPRNSEAAIDIAPGWMRVAAPYGSTFVGTRSSLFNLSAS